MSHSSGSGGSQGAGAQPQYYRRPLGGLWWAALILVPFTMGLTAWFLLGPKGGMDHSMPTASATPSAAASSAAPSSAAPSSAAVEGNFCVKRDGDKITLCGVVADDATRSAVENMVKTKFPGATIDNQITVVAGAPKVNVDELGAYLDAIGDSTNASLEYKGNTVTLTGTLIDAASGAAAAAAAGKVFEGSTVDAQFTADAPAAACDPKALNSKLRQIGRLQFGVTDATLTDEAKAQIAKDAEVLKACPAVRIDVKGFTDNTGPWASNLQLSQKRADAVKAQLVADGVPAAQIRALGHGWRYPAVPNDSAAHKALNQRAEVSVR